MPAYVKGFYRLIGSPDDSQVTAKAILATRHEHSPAYARPGHGSLRHRLDDHSFRDTLWQPETVLRVPPAVAEAVGPRMYATFAICGDSPAKGVLRCGFDKKEGKNVARFVHCLIRKLKVAKLARQSRVSEITGEACQHWGGRAVC